MRTVLAKGKPLVTGCCRLPFLSVAVQFSFDIPAANARETLTRGATDIVPFEMVEEANAGDGLRLRKCRVSPEP
jgi:hypothetical protein